MPCQSVAFTDIRDAWSFPCRDKFQWLCAESLQYWETCLFWTLHITLPKFNIAESRYLPKSKNLSSNQHFSGSPPNHPPHVARVATVQARKLGYLERSKKNIALPNVWVIRRKPTKNQIMHFLVELNYHTFAVYLIPPNMSHLMTTKSTKPWRVTNLHGATWASVLACGKSSKGEVHPTTLLECGTFRGCAGGCKHKATASVLEIPDKHWLWNKYDHLGIWLYFPTWFFCVHFPGNPWWKSRLRLRALFW